MITTGFLIFSAASLIYFAGGDAQRIDLRQEKQQRRIEHGVESGQLTPKEAQRLEKQQNWIQRMEDKVKANGVVMRKECAGLTRRQNQASRNINRKKHNLRRQ